MGASPRRRLGGDRSRAAATATRKIVRGLTPTAKRRRRCAANFITAERDDYTDVPPLRGEILARVTPIPTSTCHIVVLYPPASGLV